MLYEVITQALETIDDHWVWEETDSTPLRLAEEVVRDLVREVQRKSHGELRNNFV